MTQEMVLTADLAFVTAVAVREAHDIDDRPSAFPEGSPNRLKQLEMYGGTDIAHPLARKHGIRTGGAAMSSTAAEPRGSSAGEP